MQIHGQYDIYEEKCTLFMRGNVHFSVESRKKKDKSQEIFAEFKKMSYLCAPK